MIFLSLGFFEHSPEFEGKWLTGQDVDATVDTAEVTEGRSKGTSADTPGDLSMALQNLLSG